MSGEPFEAIEGGIRLAVRLTPRSGRRGIEGIRAEADGRPVLQIRVAASPVDGAANIALVELLAELLGLRKSEIVIRSGETSRTKILHLAGEPRILIGRLKTLLSTS